jgi:hypothetical protein
MADRYLLIDDATGRYKRGASTTFLQKFTAIAGESFAANTSFMVRYALTGQTAGRVYKADFDASSSNNFYVVGFVQPTSAVSAGGSIDVIVHGLMTLAASDVAFAAGEIGQPVHLKATGAWDAVSQITYASGQASVSVGIVAEVNKIFVLPMNLQGIN